MKKGNKKAGLYLLHSLVVCLALTLFIGIFSHALVEARHSRGHQSTGHKRSAHCKRQKQKGQGDQFPCFRPKQPVVPPPDYDYFNVLSFGAVGDGVNDDSPALLEAWDAACRSPLAQTTVVIPRGFNFLIGPITLQGPCLPHLTLQIDGSLLAPPRVSSWPRSSLFQWINFKWLQSFTIKGCGVVDGQGYEWWSQTFHSQSTTYLPQRKFKHMPKMKPTTMRFYASNNVSVLDITITNSPQFHLNFDNSRWITVDNITISSPEDSANTDGIHLQNSKDVEIKYSNIRSGDDCVSIQTGCSNVHIHHVNCGPGHGISLGGLGRDNTLACVSDIVVEDISMTSTLYGARIKTWQGGIGSVKNVSFSNFNMYQVKIPVVIDQFYCDKRRCKNQTEAVAISGVTFNRITGTYMYQPVHLACSDSVPCVDVNLIDIQLKPTVSNVAYKRAGVNEAVCRNSYGRSQAPLSPSSIDDCVRKGGGLIKGMEKPLERECQRQLFI